MSAPLSIRERLPVLEKLGLSPLEARLVTLPRLWVANCAELEEAWRLPPGLYRDKRISESCGFWQGLWSALRVHLEAGEHREAEQLLDRAIARVEPWPTEEAATRSRA